MIFKMLQKYLHYWFAVVIVSAMPLGYFFPSISRLEDAIPYLLFVMLCPMMALAFSGTAKNHAITIGLATARLQRHPGCVAGGSGAHHPDAYHALDAQNCRPNSKFFGI